LRHFASPQFWTCYRNLRNQIAGKLETAFFHHFRYKPGPPSITH
jgi:hypothetical protein